MWIFSVTKHDPSEHVMAYDYNAFILYFDDGSKESIHNILNIQ